ncbi:DUF190 domain-containing protein [Pengzhenrongella sp.]|jgi:PII-like signaling protein|uniref:DUF190 domain-containing protein n=1 Tax=Pengzhenrongella sp. TaxID=2888820 RepID=UPI002F91F3B6
MKADDTAVRPTVYIGDADQWHHGPLYSETGYRAHAAGLAGAAVFGGFEGFGASLHIHTRRLLWVSAHLPVTVAIVDTEDRIRAFLPQFDELIGAGLVILDPVEVVRYLGLQTQAPST